LFKIAHFYFQRFQDGKIEVLEKDCLEAAIDLINQGLNPGMLMNIFLLQ
jgi:hypothetical protein